MSMQESGNIIMARAEKSARKKARPITARPKTYIGSISSVTVPGAVDSVERVVNPIDHMRKRRQLASSGNKDELHKLNESAYRAAERLRAAYEVVHGQVGGAMDFDRVRGAGRPGMGPPLHYLEAAGVLNDARKQLYALDYRVVILVACEGHSIERVAEMIRGPSPTRADKEDIGRSLRQGLRELAGEAVTGDDAPRPARTWHAVDATTYSPQVAGVIERGDVVHATGHKIFRK